MGNRSYLYLAKSDHNLFEANNSLPFFWISLLDTSVLDKHKAAWEKFDELQEKDDDAAIDELLKDTPSPLDFSIDRETFERNALRTRQFLQKHYARLLPLFDDFKQYVAAQFQTDDQVILNTLEIAYFHTSGIGFLQTLYAEVEAIEQDKPLEVQYLFDDDLIASGTGFSRSDNFAETSEAYRQAMKARDAVAPRTVSNAPPPKKSSSAFWVMLFLCPVFSYIVYRGYSKEGLSAMVILLGLCNIAFYWFSISQLMAITKAGKKDKAIS